MRAWVLGRVEPASKRTPKGDKRQLQYFVGFNRGNYGVHGLGPLKLAIRFARRHDAETMAKGWSMFSRFFVYEFDFTDEENPELVTETVLAAYSPLPKEA